MKLSLGGFSTVTMTDRWFQELRAGRAFAGQAAPGAVAGQYSYVQLLNPAGSGVQSIVAQIEVTLTVADLVVLSFYDTALATDAGALANLLSGGAAGGSHVRTESTAVGFGTVYYSRWVPANDSTVIYPSWGVELSPGRGLAVTRNTVNAAIRVSFLVNEV